MPSPEMLHSVDLIRTDFSEEHIVSIIRVTRIGELRTTLAVTSNRSTLRRDTIIIANVFPGSPNLFTLMTQAIRSSETSVHRRATQRNASEEGILLTVSKLNRMYLYTNKLITRVFCTLKCLYNFWVPLYIHKVFRLDSPLDHLACVSLIITAFTTCEFAKMPTFILCVTISLKCPIPSAFHLALRIDHIAWRTTVAI
jgi:hypothetical protein